MTAAHCDFPSPPLSSQRISELLASITFKQREQYETKAGLQHKRQTVLITWPLIPPPFLHFRKRLIKLRSVITKEDPEMVMLKIALLIDEITGEPLYYKVLDGSIADVTLLRNLFAELSKLDAEQINLVLDRGFCSENNFQMMFRNNIGFAAGLKSDLKIAQQAPAGEFVPQLTLALPQQHYPEIDCYCATKKIEWYSSSRTFGKEYSPFYIHVYYDLQRETSEKPI